MGRGGGLGGVGTLFNFVLRVCVCVFGGGGVTSPNLISSKWSYVKNQMLVVSELLVKFA